MRSHFFWMLLVPIGFAACGGVASPNTSDGGTNDVDAGAHPDGSTKSDSGSSTNLRIPLNHRASGETCPVARGAGSINESCDYDSGPPPECLHDTDCTAGVNGRCQHPDLVPVACATACSYDECASDSDCPSGVPCDCRASATDSTANVCVSGSACRTDSDCGSGGYCSPSAGFGSFNCSIAYFCHTAQDTCTDDSDCGSSVKCQYDATAQHWACGGPNCAPPP